MPRTNNEGVLKRYPVAEGEVASRRVGYDFTTEYAKSGKAMCKYNQCRSPISNGELRIALMLQDIEGYKSTSWTHFDCFWKHPETRKLYDLSEIQGLSKLKKEDQERIRNKFQEFRKSNGNKKQNKRGKEEESDEEDYKEEEEEEEEEKEEEEEEEEKESQDYGGLPIKRQKRKSTSTNKRNSNKNSNKNTNKNTPKSRTKKQKVN